MGTADYCILVVLLFFSFLALCLRQEEKRNIDRRRAQGLVPGEAERRSLLDRRDDSWTTYASWAACSICSRVKSWF